jgi:hypothetical protein
MTEDLQMVNRYMNKCSSPSKCKSKHREVVKENAYQTNLELNFSFPKQLHLGGHAPNENILEKGKMVIWAYLFVKTVLLRCVPFNVFTPGHMEKEKN